MLSLQVPPELVFEVRQLSSKCGPEVLKTVVRVSKKLEVLKKCLKPVAPDEVIGGEKGLIVRWGIAELGPDLCKSAERDHLGQSR